MVELISRDIVLNKARERGKDKLISRPFGLLNSYEDEVRASSSAEVSDSLGAYVSVLSDGQL
jgi:hypothetical protein